MEEIIDRVRTLSESILSENGLELIDIEYRRESNGWVLRLFLDKEEGISLNDCTRVSQTIGRVLDVEDVIQTPYSLEVSSPGINRSLKTEKDFLKYRHHFVQLKTCDPIEQRRHFKGKLIDRVENNIILEENGKLFYIPLSNIVKANLEMEEPAFQKKHRKK